jgi:hypothetical protein
MLPLLELKTRPWFFKDIHGMNLKQGVNIGEWKFSEYLQKNQIELN